MAGLYAEPRESLVGEIYLRQRRQYVARLGPDHGEAAAILGHVAQLHAAVLRQQPAEVVIVPRSARGVETR